MNGNKLSPSDFQIFTLKSLIWLCLAWGGFLLALAGFFYGPVIWIGGCIFAIVLFRQMIVHRIKFKPGRELLIASLFILSIAIIFSLFSTPTVFSGRDQGSISNAAIRLAQNHSFYYKTPASTAFFQLHQSGRALNFPGFYYTSSGSLVTQFPLVYITWLALFFSIFGTAGFAIANAVLFFIFFLSLYLLVRLFVDTFAAIPTALFVSTSFVLMWFTKYTLSENMAIALLWTSILALMLFLKIQRKLYFGAFLATSFLLCFTRIEGFAFLFVSTIILFATTDTRQYLQLKIFKRIILPLILFAAVFILNTIVDINFYRELAKALLPSVTMPQAQYLGNLKHTDLPDFYLIRLFYLYGMLGFFLTGAVAVIIYFCKKDFYKLTAFFVTLPTFVYFLDSHISPDHPWMLRRFMFSLLPVAIFYSGLLVGELLEKKEQPGKYKLISFALIFWLLIGNLPAFSNYLFYSENKTLLEQMKQISDQFSANDLVLIDQKATSDGWAMMSEPMSSLYKKNAVYFFNLADLSKLNLDSFKNVYVIAPNEQVPYYLSSTYGKKLTYTNDYSLHFSKLDNNEDDPLEQLHFPEKKEITVQGKIFKFAK